MKLRIITIGKIKSGPVMELSAEYMGRLAHYLPFELISVKNEIDLLERIGPDDFLVVCDERGREMISTGFADFIEERQVRSTKHITFVIGPAEGFSENVLLKADIKLALSRFTLQHDFALILLLEQLYRACTIIRGEPYHK